ncbi:MAG: hypothetical protein P4M09_13260 [Devosia sp.]|nr:hypothetical protein [Devosia sp.]
MLSIAAVTALGFGLQALQQFSPLGTLGSGPPPREVMTQPVAGPYGQAMNFTVQQLSDRLSSIPGLSASWSHEANGDYIFRVSGTDRMTGRPTDFAFRFRGAMVVQLAENGVYLSALATLGELESL